MAQANAKKQRSDDEMSANRSSTVHAYGETYRQTVARMPRIAIEF